MKIIFQKNSRNIEHYDTINQFFKRSDSEQSINALHLGCGGKYIAGWCNVDYYPPVETDTHRGNTNADVWCDIRKLSCKDSSIDIIFMSHVLEHFYQYELEGFMDEIRRVLKKDGIFINEMPDLARVVRFSFFLPKKIFSDRRRNVLVSQYYGASWENNPNGYPYHKYVWTRQEFREKMHCFGFIAQYSTSATITHIPLRDQAVIFTKTKNLTPSGEALLKEIIKENYSNLLRRLKRYIIGLRVMYKVSKCH